MKKLLWLIAVLFSGVSLSAFDLDGSIQRNIGEELRYYYGENCGDVQALPLSDFSAVEEEVPMLEGSDGCHWYYFQLNNQEAQNLWLLEIYNPSVDELFLYRKQDGQWKEIGRQGRSVPHHQWQFDLPNILFELSLPAGEQEEFLLRARNREQFNLAVNIGPKDELIEENFNNQFLFGIYAGIMIVMFFYNLFLYFSVRDRSYIFYVAHTALVLLTQASFFGFTFLYLWPSFTAFAEISFIFLTCLVSIAGIRFFFEFLKVRQYTPSYYKIFRVVEILYLIILVIVLSGEKDLAYKILLPLQATVALSILFVSFRILQRGYVPARIYLISWSVLLVGIIIFALKDFGVLPYNYFTLHTIQWGSALEAVLLSFALANRINILKREKEESQAQALSALKENEQIIREQNIMLEQKVQERTMEIQEANEELQSTLNNLKETQAQLVDAEKMASLGQLTAGIAHEINNPINFVTSNITPLRRDLQDIYEIVSAYAGVKPEDAEGGLEKAHALQRELDYDYLREEIDSLVQGISDGAVRTQEIVKGLRTFSRLDEDVIKLADLNEGLDSTLIILQNKIKNNIELIRDYQKDLTAVECFPGKLNQVFMNILNNAIYAVEKKTYTEGEKPKISVSTRHVGDFVNIVIADNGIGMNEQTRKKIFEPFYTTKDVGEGTGLGMSIVFKIIEKHKGKIDVQSEAGVGTEFIITLPLRQPNEDKR